MMHRPRLGYILVFGLLFAACSQGATCTRTPPDPPSGGTLTSLSSLSLNRTALVGDWQLPHAQLQFRWNDGDNDTEDWRPQGITEIPASQAGGRRHLAVTWYDRTSGGRGARVSFVDISQPGQIEYRHVLLIDLDGTPLSGLHAGGITYVDGELHVADSRGPDYMLVFPLSQMYEVPVGPTYHNYRYVLQRHRRYTVAVTPSFASFDASRNQLIVGSYHNCSAEGDGHHDTQACLGQGAQIMWRDATLGGTGVTRGPFFTEMQGAASHSNRIWISCSHHRSYPSHLHYGQFDPDDAAPPDPTSWQHVVYVPGLEDLHYSPAHDELWLLTEFGSTEGSGNDRFVFSLDPDDLP